MTLALTKDQEKLKALFDTGNLAEAYQLLNRYLDSELSLEEKGLAYATFIQGYLDVMSAVNLAYEQELDSLLTRLDELETFEQEELDGIALSQVRAEINHLHAEE